MKQHSTFQFAFPRQHLRFLLVVLIVFGAPTLLLVAQLPWKLGQSAPGGGSAASVSHVFIIVMEDRGYHQIIGNPQALYSNSLARTYGLATNYTALSHHDLPNDLQLAAGSNLGITTNCDACFVSGASLASEIESAGKTWKAYLESMPANCFLENAGSYLPAANPFAYFADFRASCRQHDVPYTQFHADLAGGHLPDLIWIAPNDIDAMGSGTVAQGDAWLAREVPAILHSSAYLNNGILFITWDAADAASPNNQVATLVISPLTKTAFQSSTSYTHYSLLRTMEDLLGLRPLGASAQARPMTDFFGGSLLVSQLLNLVPHPPGASPPASQTPQAEPAGGMPRVQGAHILDGSGHPLTFRGAQIASPLNFIAGWQTGQDPFIWLNPAVFLAMASWHMNILRLPVTTWYYTQPNFLTKLDTIIAQANQAGIYVVIAAFDNAKSGSPYGSGADVPKAENIPFWTAMASRYAKYPMVLFDLFNEPSSITAQNYLNGGGSVTGSTGKVAQIIGFQPLVDAIRSTGAKQIVIAPADIPAANPSIRLRDPNVMYTIHIYAGIGTVTPASWDQDWGSLLGKYPLYYGEWAVLPNSLVPAQCQPYTPANVDSDTNAFLQYMGSRGINWTAWEFRTYYLIQNDTTFSPTTFQGAWVACDSNGQEGMGSDVKNYLANPP